MLIGIISLAYFAQQWKLLPSSEYFYILVIGIRKPLDFFKGIVKQPWVAAFDNFIRHV